jgi:UDP:flavonoid glycosyltransferase YjiC (YdhE family)
VGNYDFGQLVAPTLAALANEPDVLAVVTAGGRPVDAIPGPLPTNARAASYLPFEWALAKADVLVTNGGYGSVNQALSFGVPLVTAGLIEDKADINVRVAWSGVGVNLATNEPTSEALREAQTEAVESPSQSGSSRGWSVIGLGRQKALRQRGTNGTSNARYPGISDLALSGQ